MKPIEFDGIRQGVRDIMNEKRFRDWQAEHEKERFLETVGQLRRKRRGAAGSLETFRSLRGYGKQEDENG